MGVRFRNQFYTRQENRKRSYGYVCMIPNKKHYARQGLRQHTGKDKQCDVVRLTCGKARSTCSPVNPGSNTHFKNIRIAHTYGTFSFKNINNTPNSTNDMILKSRAKKTHDGDID